jgi:hypothetical protein
MSSPLPRTYNADTRSPETVQAYRQRYGQLKRTALTELGSSFEPSSFVDWVIDVKRQNWNASTWRQNRAAIKEGLTGEVASEPGRATQIKRAIERLDQTRSALSKARTPRTSAKKAKRFAIGDMARIRHAALASASPNAQVLADILLATSVAGLRPIEWRSAKFGPSSVPGFAYEMTVRNAKHNAVRGHGEFRTLRWTGLDMVTARAIKRSIDVAQGAKTAEHYKRIISTLAAMMRRLTAALFPRRKKRPTLYTARHEAIAHWKLHYVETQSTPEGRLNGLAIVAALSGHATDETATMHYGRSRRDERTGRGIPQADPSEVARIRPRMSMTLTRLLDLKARSIGQRPR